MELLTSSLAISLGFLCILLLSKKAIFVVKSPKSVFGGSETSYSILSYFRSSKVLINDLSNLVDYFF